MSKLNCWEFKKCGREPEGAKADDLGVCPVAAEVRANGINAGKNGGRACWAIPGRACGGTGQDEDFAGDGDCMQCAFYKMVENEEGSFHTLVKEILTLLQ